MNFKKVLAVGLLGTSAIFAGCFSSNSNTGDLVEDKTNLENVETEVQKVAVEVNEDEFIDQEIEAFDDVEDEVEIGELI